MEIFPPLTSFYNAIAGDTRIGASHISIYMALLQQWNLNGGTNPILIQRQTVMKRAKILARHTYNKCMNELKEYGFIRYEPASNGSFCSKVFLNESEMKK